jgi:hypothetical protein
MVVLCYTTGTRIRWTGHTNCYYSSTSTGSRYEYLNLHRTGTCKPRVFQTMCIIVTMITMLARKEVVKTAADNVRYTKPLPKQRITMIDRSDTPASEGNLLH